ncbi:MAG: winged helix-turn-helix domain-containing protein [Nitrososphaera sp.]|nr:winged helix-turn-helix domain-containing protein [Nitrososphaera sp.]
MWELSNAESYLGVFRRGTRGTIDIIADILSLGESWTRKTTIMYKANLSHQMLKFYLWHMVELGLLEESEDMQFRTTEKGKEFLAYYQKIGRLLADIGGPAKRRHYVTRQGNSALRE